MGDAVGQVVIEVQGDRPDYLHFWQPAHRHIRLQTVSLFWQLNRWLTLQDFTSRRLYINWRLHPVQHARWKPLVTTFID